MPSFRCGHGHIFNNYYENSANGIEARVGAQLLVYVSSFLSGVGYTGLISDSENNVFANVPKAVFADKGFAWLAGNDLGGGSNTAPQGTSLTMPYSYSLDATSSVKTIVTAGAGANLSF
jgi:pectate lyase